MVQLLGGTIAIRHGSRSHWSSDNTALHCVRMHGSHFVVIEENELASPLLFGHQTNLTGSPRCLVTSVPHSVTA
jgi:hypothetical protein